MEHTTFKESTGERLARLRRAQNLTQEALAEQLGVSRQAVSKWESDITYPETDKLLRLSRLYGCTVDELLTGETPDRGTVGRTPDAESASSPEADAASPKTDTDSSDVPLGAHIAAAWEKRPRYLEYKSRRTVRGIPLVHINIGLGRRARGIVAIGLTARGVIAVGLASVGVVSAGMASVGLISVAVFSLALLLSVGCISIGTVAIGAIALGVISIGAVAVGMVSLGAVAVGRFLAIGDWAFGDIALGQTVAEGDLFSHVGSTALSAADLAQAEAQLTEHCPGMLREIARFLLHVVCRG